MRMIHVSLNSFNINRDNVSCFMGLCLCAVRHKSENEVKHKRFFVCYK